MGKRKLLTVLYFLEGAAPTPEDEAAMSEFGQGHVIRQRNALLIHDGDAIEDFDLVAGAVPPSYAAAAAEKGEPPAPKKAKPVKPDAVAPESPVAPSEAPEGTSEAVGEPEAVAAPAEVVPPKPKGAARGWKPNA
jgi:hypothetical protein